MTTAATKFLPKMNADEFFTWSHLPENQSRKFELHHGVPVKIGSPDGFPSPSGEVHGLLTMWIGHLLITYVINRGIGMVMGSDAGLVINEELVLKPDLMLVDETIALKDAKPNHCRRVPLLCVEILSPSDQMSPMLRKIQHYFSLGTSLVWIIDPEVECVQVYRRGDHVRVLDATETLTGNGILPDFSCPVADLFRLPGTAG